MIKAIMLLAVAAALTGLSACAHHNERAAVTTSQSSTYAK